MYIYIYMYMCMYSWLVQCEKLCRSQNKLVPIPFPYNSFLCRQIYIYIYIHIYLLEIPILIAQAPIGPKA